MHRAFWQGKIFFVHFRDIAGTKACFHETFHDNGQTDMARAIRCYRDVHCTAPIRVDHVPTMAGEENGRPGYETVGRLYAIGYLRGLLALRPFVPGSEHPHTTAQPRRV